MTLAKPPRLVTREEAELEQAERVRAATNLSPVEPGPALRTSGGISMLAFEIARTTGMRQIERRRRRRLFG